MVGPKLAKASVGRANPALGRDRCTEALNAEATAVWQRRVSLLRARARFAIWDKAPAKAIEDLDALEKIEVRDPVYDHSFGTSVLMLRAAANLQSRNFVAARDAALAAAERRPWSYRIASFAVAFDELAPSASGEAPVWARYVALQPDGLERRAKMRAMRGDWTAALSDWRQARTQPGAITTTYIDVPNVRVSGAPGVPISGVSLARVGEAAIIAVMAGAPEQADVWLAEGKASLASPPKLPDYLQRLVINDTAARATEFARWEKLTEVARLWRNGDSVAARSALIGLEQIPRTPVVRKLIATVAPSSQDLDGLYQSALASRMIELFVGDQQYLDQIPNHDAAETRNRYRGTVKFLRASGFSEKPTANGSGVKIDYFGDKTPIIAVEEMALLRAAELAKARGAPTFTISSRSDYRMTSQQTLNGSPIGPVADAGFGSSLDVSFVAAAGASTATPTLEALLIESALAPVYIDP